MKKKETVTSTQEAIIDKMLYAREQKEHYKQQEKEMKEALMETGFEKSEYAGNNIYVTERKKTTLKDDVDEETLYDEYTDAVQFDYRKFKKTDGADEAIQELMEKHPEARKLNIKKLQKEKSAWQYLQENVTSKYITIKKKKGSKDLDF